MSYHEFFLEEKKAILPLFGMWRQEEFFGEAQIIFLEFPADQLLSWVHALGPC